MLFMNLIDLVMQDMEFVMLMYFPLALVFWIAHQLTQEFAEVQSQSKILQKKNKMLRKLDAKF